MNQQMRITPTLTANAAQTAHLSSRRAAQEGTARSIEVRRAALEGLLAMVTTHEAELAAALAEDMGRSAAEAWTSELTTVEGEAHHALANLDKWARPEKASVPFKLWPARARIQYEP
ncbi:MAG: hypothetical protein WA908_10820, partial [Pontixanthobacter sp.]